MAQTPRTLYEKIWDAHVVERRDDGTCLIYIDRHLVHEVTSPQAFEGLRLAGRRPWRPDTVIAVADHNVPTTPNERLTTEAIIAEIDRKMSEQINAIIHHADYQQLESAWRGLHYLVNNTETDEMLKIRFMNISKNELGRTLKRFKGTAWDQSPIFKKLYEEEYGQFGGEPYGCLVGDYHFDHTPPDVELLGEMSKIAAAAQW